MDIFIKAVISIVKYSMIIQHDHTENFLSSVACYLYPTHTMQVYQDSRNRRHSGSVHCGYAPPRKAYSILTPYTAAGQLRIRTVFPTLSLSTSVSTYSFVQKAAF